MHLLARPRCVQACPPFMHNCMPLTLASSERPATIHHQRLRRTLFSAACVVSARTDSTDAVRLTACLYPAGAPPACGLQRTAYLVSIYCADDTHLVVPAALYD